MWKYPPVFGRKWGRVDERIDRVLEGLQAQFESSIAREEEAAADDLAASLLADRPLNGVLGSAGRVEALAGDGARLPVAAVGDDYVETASIPRRLIPLLGLAFLQHVGGAPPTPRRRRLVEALRAVMRAGGRVQVVSSGITHTGPLMRVGPDYLALKGRSGIVAVPLAAVSEIRLLPEGSADAP